MRRLGITAVLCIFAGIAASAAPTYEYRRELREGARGKWTNLRQHLNSGQRLEKELTKVDKQIDKKVAEIQEIEDLLFRIEQYKAENNVR
jgi:hypothetical protein